MWRGWIRHTDPIHGRELTFFMYGPDKDDYVTVYAESILFWDRPFETEHVSEADRDRIAAELVVNYTKLGCYCDVSREGFATRPYPDKWVIVDFLTGRQLTVPVRVEDGSTGVSATQLDILFNSGAAPKMDVLDLSSVTSWDPPFSAVLVTTGDRARLANHFEVLYTRLKLNFLLV